MCCYRDIFDAMFDVKHTAGDVIIQQGVIIIIIIILSLESRLSPGYQYNYYSIVMYTVLLYYTVIVYYIV